MNVRKTGAAMLQRLFAKYLDLLRRTVAVRWDDGNRYGDSQIYGFWHEDSFFMNLVLERLADRTTPVDVIVTADARGNYIEYMVRQCGGNALRVPDGYGAFTALKKIVKDSYEKTHSIAVALDGPLGPRHHGFLLLVHPALAPLGPIRDPAAVEHGGRVGEKLRSGQKGLHSETARLTYCTRE